MRARCTSPWPMAGHSKALFLIVVTLLAVAVHTAPCLAASNVKLRPEARPVSERDDAVLPAESVVVVQTAPTQSAPEPGLMEKIKHWISQKIDASSPALTRKLLRADVSPQCSIGLLKLVRGIRNLEPWALRLFDASGKYPTGALQATKADLGAFDECIETVVREYDGHVTARGQYCNLLYFATDDTDVQRYILPAMAMSHPRVNVFRNHLFSAKIPSLRLGICVLNYCTEQELQALINAVVPRQVRLRVENCVDGDFPSLSRTQVFIMSFLGTITFTIVLGTLTDAFTSRTTKTASKERSKCTAGLVETLKSFSVISNTRMLLSIAKDKGSDSHRYRFLHGIRFLSITWVVVGHCYGSPSDTWSRVVNNIIFADRWYTMIVPAGFIGVDTFFFLSGFLLAYAVAKQKQTGPILFAVAVVRRYVRTMVPPFFLIMCMCMLPAITSGPDAKAYFDNFYYEVKKHWKSLLLQVNNYNHEDNGSGKLPILPHFWYLSLDFQFFLITLIILLVLKSKPRFTIAIFAFLTLVGSAVGTWQVAGNDMPPFIVVIDESVANFFRTMYHYYFYPPYHAACYFAGPITFLLLERFRKSRISASAQAAGWCIAIVCGLCCIFMKLGWYSTKYPTTEFGKLSTAFFDRILWSIFMAWVTLACASGRGGFLCTFLSWGAFAPMARLAFGVYLVHLPFIQLVLHISRERMFLSHFIVASFCFSTLVWSYIVSYFLFIFCEAPTGKLEKLVFEGLRGAKRRKSDEDAGNAMKQHTINGFDEQNNNNNNYELPTDVQRFGLQLNGVKSCVETSSCRL